MKILEKKEAAQNYCELNFTLETLLCCLCGLCLSLVSEKGLAYSVVFSLGSYLSLYGTKEGTGLVLFFLCGCFFKSFWQFYFALILLCIYALLNALIKLMKGSTVFFIPINAALVGTIAAVVLEKEIAMSLLQLIVVLLLGNRWMNSMHQKIEQIRNNPFFLFLVLSAIGILTTSYFKTLGWAWIILIDLIFSLRLSMTDLFCVLLVQTVLMPELTLIELIPSFLLMNGFKKESLIEQFLAFFVPLLFLNLSWKIIVAQGLLFVAAALIHKTLFSQPMKEDVGYHPQLNCLEHQMIQFSRIFELINQFFDQQQGLESNLLKGMSEAILNLSLQLKQSSSFMQEESVRIKKLLEGYHFHVVKAEVSLTRLSQKKVVLHLEHCSRQDAKEVILPLMNMMINKGLKLTGFYQKRGLSSICVVEFCTAVPLHVHTDIYQYTKEDHLSGDTCCRFDCHDLCICTLSDGMGTGIEANRMSSFVTELTQRLLSAGMPIESAIKTMNQFIGLKKQESFATLDVLILDRLQKQAYLCKSGTCCTLLLRNHQVLKLHSNSLPLGIVEEIEAEFYRIDLKEGDLFVLFSDGLKEETAEEILLKSKRQNISHAFEQLIQHNSFQDDTTVLLAEIFER